MRQRATQWGMLWGLCSIGLFYCIPWYVTGQSILQDGSRCRVLNQPVLRYLSLKALQCPEDCVCLIEEAQWRYRSNGILSLPTLHITKSPIISQAIERPHYNVSLESLSRDLFDTLCFGQTRRSNVWGGLIGAYGLRHLLCFSGWHAHKLWAFSGRKCMIFGVIGGLYLMILKMPFAFLCAYTKVLLKAFAPKDAVKSLWPLSLIIGQLLCPFCWTQMGYWLTIYYITLIETTGFCEHRIRLSGLGWSALFGVEIEVWAWIMGTYIEPYFIYFMGSVVLAYSVHFWAPDGVNRAIQYVFEGLNYGRLYSCAFTVPPVLGIGLLIVPFFLRTNRTARVQ